MLDALEACLGGKGYDNKEGLDTRIREVIAEADLINSDWSDVNRQVQAAFAPVSEKVRMMAEASPTLSGLSHQAELWYAPSTDMTWRKTLGGIGYADHNWQIVHGEREALKLMAHAHRMEVWQVPGSGLQHRPLRTFVVCRFPNRRFQDFLHSFGNVRGEWESAIRSAAAGVFGRASTTSRKAS